MLSIEETVNISIENEELREIRTLGEVKSFIERKISGAPANPRPDRAGRCASTVGWTSARVCRNSRRFCSWTRRRSTGRIVRAKYTIRGDEFFLEGHFKDNPVMPASLVFEAIGQAACLWVLECAPEQLGTELQNNEVLFASMEEAHFYRRAKPGDVLEMEAEMVRLRAPLAVFRGRATLRGERLAQIEHLMLAFGQEVVEHLDKHEADSAAATGGAAAPVKSLAADAMPAEDSPFTDAPAPGQAGGRRSVEGGKQSCKRINAVDAQTSRARWQTRAVLRHFPFKPQSLSTRRLR